MYLGFHSVKKAVFSVTMMSKTISMIFGYLFWFRLLHTQMCVSHTIYLKLYWLIFLH